MLLGFIAKHCKKFVKRTSDGDFPTNIRYDHQEVELQLTHFRFNPEHLLKINPLSKNSCRANDQSDCQYNPGRVWSRKSFTLISLLGTNVMPSRSLGKKDDIAVGSQQVTKNYFHLFGCDNSSGIISFHTETIWTPCDVLFWKMTCRGYLSSSHTNHCRLQVWMYMWFSIKRVGSDTS